MAYRCFGRNCSLTVASQALGDHGVLCLAQQGVLDLRHWAHPTDRQHFHAQPCHRLGKVPSRGAQPHHTHAIQAASSGRNDQLRHRRRQRPLRRPGTSCSSGWYQVFVLARRGQAPRIPRGRRRSLSPVYVCHLRRRSRFPFPLNGGGHRSYLQPCCAIHDLALLESRCLRSGLAFL
jgi:hypothetical protein